MNQSLQSMKWTERFQLLKKLKTDSKTYRSFSLKVSILRFVFLFCILFFGLELFEFNFITEVILIVTTITAFDYLVDRFILSPKANQELKRLNISSVNSELE